MLKGLGAVVAVLVAALVWRFQSIGEFRTLKPTEATKHWATCHKLPQLSQGAEDFVVDSTATYAYISSCDFGAVMSSGNMSLARGRLFRLTLASEALEQLELEGVEGVFMPHGVALAPGDAALLVVVHSPRGDCVLELELAGLRAVRRRSVCSPLFVALNAVAAFGEAGGFLAVNDHRRSQFASPLLATLETVVGLASSSVVHCSAGSECRTVIADLPPVSVGLAARDHLVFVSIPFRASVGVYNATQNFAAVREIPIGTGADNLHFDVNPLGNGDTLWIGAHPYLLKALTHMLTGRPCASQVLAIHNASSAHPFVQVVRQRDSADPVSAVSTGMFVGGKMLLGTVRDGFAICTQ